ncbi:hypothetical protein [Tenacibaculum finnmarkense]|uniref:hypothetical protein n=2 Tax=Tenacibaculum finnmarkense TaxID=2781243 RepID=UPI00187B4234|nr:hypothetical protein [Tenacibaculum finnmarkense]MCG8783276.1 hypothetical protein [Tenacibaculum finnmarkense]
MMPFFWYLLQHLVLGFIQLEEQILLQEVAVSTFATAFGCIGIIGVNFLTSLF